jgi:hypothetical protein
MFKLWIEWDFGQDDFIFKTKEDAKHWFRENVNLDDLGDEFRNHQQIFDEGYAGFERLKVYVRTLNLGTFSGA